MKVKVITDLSAEPVLLADVKNRIKATYGTDTTEDAEINSQIKAARELIEKETNLSLGSKVIEIFFYADEVFNRKIKLPYGPHSAMTDGYPVRVNQQGTETAMTLNTDYYKRGNQFWEIEFLTSSENPWTDEDSALLDDYKVRLTAGYGASNCESLPEAFKQAIKLQVLQWWRNGFDGQLDQKTRQMIAKFSNKSWL